MTSPPRRPKGPGSGSPSPRPRPGISLAPSVRPAQGVAATAPISPARLAAAEILEEVAATGAHSDDLLHGPRLRQLSQVDRDLTTTLVLGVLRWQIALDGRIQPLLSRPDLKLAEPVQIVLRLGAFQILHLARIPVHAALNESVELVRFAGHPHAAGMVNAVLRKLATAPAPRQPLVESTAAFAERLGHPLWLAERWVKLYGRAAAEAVCASDQQPPSASELFAPGTGGPSLPPMDPGSRLVAELAAASQPGAARVWDCCAAPGGKTLVMAHRLPQAQILATDKSPSRLKRLAERLATELPGRATAVEQADAAAMPDTAGVFDLVLCDVPCSGTGTLARNPEIRHRLALHDLARQAERQRSILEGASQRLAPGGRLLYSTCSLEPEENEAVVEHILRENGALRLLPVAPLLEGLRKDGLLRADHDAVGHLLRGSYLRTLPGSTFGGDGFFAALFELA